MASPPVEHKRERGVSSFLVQEGRHCHESLLQMERRRGLGSFLELEVGAVSALSWCYTGDMRLVTFSSWR